MSIPFCLQICSRDLCGLAKETKAGPRKRFTRRTVRRKAGQTNFGNNIIPPAQTTNFTKNTFLQRGKFRTGPVKIVFKWSVLYQIYLIFNRLLQN